MKRPAFLAMFLLCSCMLIGQARNSENLPCSNTMDGSILFDSSGTVLFVTTNNGTYRPGDGYSSIFFSTFAEYGYTSFDISSITSGCQVLSATYFCYISGCWADDVHYYYPLFQMSWGTINPELLLTHIDYGDLDPSDINPVILHMPLTLANSYTPGWNSVDVTDLLIDDIQNNRTFSQFMLSLHHTSDWDLMNDSVVIHAAGFDTSPYILVEFDMIPSPPIIVHEPINTISSDLLPMAISATITDDTGISSAVLAYKINLEGEIVNNLENTTGDTYECTISPVLPASGGHFFYKILATDFENSASSLPASGWFDIEFTPTSSDDPMMLSSDDGILVHPNPFLASCSIEVVHKTSNDNVINIYNLRGQLIQSYSSFSEGFGDRSVSWNGNDSSGKQVCPGVYIVQLVNSNGVFAKKLLKMK